MTTNDNILAKKQREQKLVEEFFAICGDYKGAALVRYSENPDLIYNVHGKELGFESIIVAEDQEAIACHFDQANCRVNYPSLESASVDFKQLTEEIIRTLYKHLRTYAIPTVLVFSVLDETINLIDLAKHFTLPEFSTLNIIDYYLANKTMFIKLSENELSHG